MSGCLRCLACLSFFKGPTPPVLNLPAATCSPVFEHPDFLQRLVPKVLKMGSPGPRKITQFCTNSALKRTRDQDLLKDSLSRRGQTSIINDSSTLSAVFKKAQGSQKGREMEATIEYLGTQYHKSPEKKTLEKSCKTTTPKRELVCVLGGGPRVTFFLQNSINSSNWAPGLQNGPPCLHGSQNGASEPSKSLKNHDSDVPNLENTIAKLLKNGTVAGYARSALDNLKTIK